MRQATLSVPTLCAGAVAMAVLWPPAQAQTDLVRNGSFESAAGGAAVDWASTRDPRNGVTAAVTVEAGKAGANSVRIQCTAYPPAERVIPTSHADLYQKGIGLVRGQRYRLSFWSKGRAADGQAARVRLVDTSDWDYHAVARHLELTEDWAQTEVDFQAARDVRAAVGMLWFTLDAVGSLWLDDVRLICQQASDPPRYQPRVPALAGAKNLIPNSSFEAGTDGWATLGKTTGWGGDVSGLVGRIDATEAHEGRQCLRLDLGPGKTPVTHFDCWPACRQVQDAPLAASLGWIEVTKGQPLTLSAWLRADRVGVPAELVFRFGGDPAAGVPPRRVSSKVALGTSWGRYQFSTTATEADVCIAVGPNLTGAPDPAATVWIDAVQLEVGPVASAYERRQPVEIGFGIGEFAGFIPAGEPTHIRVSGANGSDSPARLDFTLTLEDYFGTPLPAQSLALDLVAHDRLDRDWTVPLPGTGFYRGQISWQTDGLREARTVRLVTFPSYAEKDSPFGINHAPVSEDLVRALLRAGVTWARDWSVLWGHLEPEPGKLSFAAADAQIQRLLDLGMHVACLLPPLPATDWNSTASDSVPPRRWDRMAYRPRDPDALFGFIRAAAERYRGKVDVLEFLNEPIWTEFCLPGASHQKPGAQYTPADYLGLLRRAHPAMKAGNPNCTVIGGFSAEPWRFTKEFIESGGLDFVDVLNVHNYGGSAPPESYIGGMQALLQQMDRAGRRRPIWITEYAYYGLDEYPWLPWQPLPTAWSHNRLLRDERQCADWSIRYDLIMLAHGVEKLFYHQGASGEVNYGSANVEFPLLGEQGKPLKLYAAQAIAAGILGPKPVPAGELQKPAKVNARPTTGVYGYAFQCGPRAVLAAWCVEGQAAAEPWLLRAPEDVEASDLMGNRLPAGQVGLGVSPVYLTSTARPARELAEVCGLTGQGGSAGSPQP